ncbi:hypothetical protein FGIG_03156 [Fasciola gigantica]|uniref:Uncharacterized protein n=1 Tax=Fasciola gigantica TaxID=46835 RepID=A0A504YFI7_FASGI|nr:hypothetical protein FGIG_03156 [Fasciola gigantica]
MQEYDFQYSYRARKKHTSADTLSRIPQNAQINSVFADASTDVSWKNAQVNHPYTSFIYKRQEENGLKPFGIEMSERPRDERALWAEWTKPAIINGMLQLLGKDNQIRVVVPRT